MDPIADMLVTIKNGYMAKKPEVLVPYSKFKSEVAKVLEKEKFVGIVKKSQAHLALPRRPTSTRDEPAGKNYYQSFIRESKAKITRDQKSF